MRHRTIGPIFAAAIVTASAAPAVCQTSSRTSIQRLTRPGAASTDAARPYDPRHDRLIPAGENPIGMRSLPAVARNAAAAHGGPFVAMFDDLEAAMVLPANPDFQLTTPVWTESTPGVPDGDVSEWQGQVTPYAGFVADPVSGNATIKARIFTHMAWDPDQFFFGLTFDMQRLFDGELEPLLLLPDATQNARLESEMFVANLTTVYSNEPIDGESGFITSRVFWGGTCGSDGSDCNEIGLPNCYPGGANTDPGCSPEGYVKNFYVLGPNANPSPPGRFVPCVYIDQAPLGSSVGDRVEVPIGQWVTMVHEATEDGRILHKIDYQDGAGEFIIYDGIFLTGTRIGAWGANSSLEGQDDAIYFDNFAASGIRYEPPVPPPLECDYLDDLDWMEPGQLAGQSNRWFDALSSRAQVVPSGNPGQALRQSNNVVSNNAYREEFPTELPLSIATTSQWELCTDIRTSAFTQTVRGFTPTANAFGSFVTRVLIGRDDGVMYDNGVYVQTNPDYQPIDDADCGPSFNCFVGDSGPNNDEGGVPVLGVDVDATGYMWPHDNAYRELCISVDSSATMWIEVSGVLIYVGATLNGVTVIDELRNESENNSMGPGDSYTIDNVALKCDEEPYAFLPPLEFVYLDELAWGITNVPVGLHLDAAAPEDPFRWASDLDAVIQPDALRSADKLLAIENRLRNQSLLDDDGNGDGLINAVQKAMTTLPEQIVDDTNGWVVSCDISMTDLTTTRFFRAMESASGEPGEFVVITTLAIAAGGDLWIQLPNGPNASFWSDTGVNLAADLAIQPGEWFTLAIARHPAGRTTYRINGALLRDGEGEVVLGYPLQSTENGVHEDLAAFAFASGEESSADEGSTLFVDNVHAHTLPCDGDIDGDGLVSFTDLNALLVSFGTTGNDPANIAPDDNSDGVPEDDVVGIADLNALLSGFGSICD